MLDANQCKHLFHIVQERSGISLGEDKIYLLETRLLPVARNFSLDNVEMLLQSIQKKEDEAIINEIIEALTTNESSFFRDITPFKLLTDEVIPHVLAHKRPNEKLRIWSAACSTGQEPYTVAMSILNNPKLANQPFEILATDISLHALEIAKKGEYTQFEVQRGIPTPLLIKYFSQHKENWKINSDIQSYVTFEQGNLVREFGDIGKFDIVLCRNVLIYFDQETKKDILTRIAKHMAPHAIIFLGCSESMLVMKDLFDPFDNNTGIHQFKSDTLL